ncbi:CidA/LrgA family protein [Mesobacillus maritimus]|uniref:CidA/LrgA family protein n=1 Tax=Mesobacillus maritimus TaxID=1643336 RepID=A0ABS7K1K4_9BACI|nr:CidA/LrgA family protein [Mesobacillus maritimus]MBY0096020.1 CidA/LrgA family protein [Mesobacillus maritimus]
MRIKWIFQFFIIIGFLLLGYGIEIVVPIPLPASVIGMLLLFLFLLAGVIKLEWVEKVSSFHLKHLPLLFIPPIATLFISSSIFKVLQWDIMLVLIVSSISCLLGTAITVEWYENRKGRRTK